MARSLRMFEIIQVLRQAPRPVTAAQIAEVLEVTVRTVYRDIAALQARQVPIEGEAGIGYMLRSGFDLPPLMFTLEELDAITTGLSLLGRTGDSSLSAAAARVAGKIQQVTPAGTSFTDATVYASSAHHIPESQISPQTIREAIHGGQRLKIDYCDTDAATSHRTILPIATIYYIRSIVVVAWCDLREDFRHFRLDRIASAVASGAPNADESSQLRAAWRQQIKDARLTAPI